MLQRRLLLSLELVPRFRAETCGYAASGGHFEILKYAHEKGCPLNEEICEAAAAGGHLEILKYVHEKGCPWYGEICCFAASGGHLELL